jgi:hypothetical protein
MTRVHALLALTLCVLLQTGLAAQRRDASPAAPPPSLQGTVVTIDSRTPVRGAEVRATPGERPAECADLRRCEPRTAVTDDEGRFELRDLWPGPWQVAASKTGFITWHYGQRRPFEQVEPIELAPEERLALEIPIPRASAISGRVYDEYGTPITGAALRVFRSRMVQGRRRLVEAGRGDYSDDTGAFRLYGLPPGDYYVAASLRVAPLDSVVETTYAPTYFPGTGNFAEAQRITLDVAAEATAVFQLLPVRHVRISGSVFTSDGAPARAFLNLMSEGTEFGVPIGIGGATREDGTFTLPDIAPGRYTLYASLRDGGAEGADMPLTVGYDDLSGLAIVTSKGTTLRGTFVADQGVARPVPAGLGMTARSPRQGGPMTAATVDGNRLDLSAPPNPFRLEVHEVPEGWTVKQILVDGEDVTDRTIDLRPRQEAAVRVVLTDRVTEVRGRVFPPGSSHAGAVVLFPEDPARWTSPSRYIRTVAVDTTGAFSAAGLPPGVAYLGLAVDYLEEGEGEDPEFLARMVAGATPFTLAEGEVRTLDLGLISR